MSRSRSAKILACALAAVALASAVGTAFAIAEVRERVDRAYADETGQVVR